MKTFKSKKLYLKKIHLQLFQMYFRLDETKFLKIHATFLSVYIFFKLILSYRFSSYTFYINYKSKFHISFFTYTIIHILLRTIKAVFPDNESHFNLNQADAGRTFFYLQNGGLLINLLLD